MIGFGEIYINPWRHFIPNNKMTPHTNKEIPINA